MEHLCSIADAQKRLGGISRTTFYMKILPKLDAIGREMGIPATSRVGARRMICTEVLGEFMVRLARNLGWLIYLAHGYFTHIGLSHRVWF